MEKVCYYLISNVMGNNLPLTAYGHTGIGGRKNDMKTGGWVVGRSDMVVSVCVFVSRDVVIRTVSCIIVC